MLTADTITDVQIRLLHSTGRIDYEEARVALDEPYGSATSAWADYNAARARCAEILNAREARP